MTTFNEYTEFVKTMKVYPEKHAIIYPVLGLAGEAGEIAEKVKKWLRGDKELDKHALLLELGDPLWYITSAADDLGFTLQDVINANVEKLQSRKDRGVLKGDGDNR
jgi:NTP pyrophosphatase (non-canonical NTP hydrolase)